jgi:hypothetical protein
MNNACKLLILGLILLPAAWAADPPVLKITTKGPHPLAETIWAIQNKYNWLINYEEPPVAALNELTDKITPTGHTMLIRSMKPISTVLSMQDAESSSTERQLAIINTILAAYKESGASDSFRAIQQGSFIDIVPVSMRGENGQTQAFDPILNTRISFPETHFANIYSFVQQVIEQVSSKRGVQIVLGEVPNNLFRQAVVESAQDELARDVLARAFWSMNGPRLAQGLDMAGVTWTLLYDPESRGYWFSTIAVAVKDRVAATPQTLKASRTRPGLAPK